VIKGPGGETYVRFSKRDGAHATIDIKAHLTIVGPDGKQVASTDMEYG
jgi:hypothetical protein